MSGGRSQTSGLRCNAVKTTALTRNADNLEAELALLHALDRSGVRLDRIKTSSAVPANQEAPAVTQAFENAFLPP